MRRVELPSVRYYTSFCRASVSGGGACGKEKATGIQRRGEGMITEVSILLLSRAAFENTGLELLVFGTSCPISQY